MRLSQSESADTNVAVRINAVIARLKDRMKTIVAFPDRLRTQFSLPRNHERRLVSSGHRETNNPGNPDNKSIHHTHCPPCLNPCRAVVKTAIPTVTSAPPKPALS